ncbi:MAG: hypothetical protein KIT14_08060 [bacterium]|nr:hypothetical protein [bacterium]
MLAIRSTLAPVFALVAAVVLVGTAHAQEPAACLSSDPASWPQPSKPYFLVIADSSASLTTAVAAANACGYPNTRLGHLRCALRNTINAYAGLANFGLATYASQQTGCDAGCGTCVTSDLPGGANGCGPGSGATRAGANIVVPIAQDDNLLTPPNPQNAPSFLAWFDNTCSGNTELYAGGNTPLNGALRDAYRYLSNQWTFPGGAPTFSTPLASAALGERACRPVQVVLVTDSDENCDPLADAVAAAQQLFATGITLGGNAFAVKTWVINFAGGTQAQLDQIAAAGGTGAALFAANEGQLTQALTAIVTGAIKRETCNNLDDDCNGCTDEGFGHFANQRPLGQCCAWANATQRTLCLNNFATSITAGTPKGNPALLPCTTAAQAQNPAQWLCYESPDGCDGIDNDADGLIDEDAVCGPGQTCVGGACHP